MNYLLILVICICLVSCKSEKHFVKIDQCKDIEKSARNLGENGKSFFLRNGSWPHQGQELDEEIKRSRSEWSSFSGGRQNWKIEVTSDHEFKVEFMGKGADDCKKTYVFTPPSTPPRPSPGQQDAKTREGVQQWQSATADWPYSARAAVYSPSATPSFDSPEGVARLLEQRWSLADIRAFCIPARRLNPEYQNLVVDSPEAWKGRLYSDQHTGFDGISWYATVRDGRLLEYSLGADRGDDYWLLEIGNRDTTRTPPKVTPDPSADCFIGHE